MHQISAQPDGIGFFTNLVSKRCMAKQDEYVRYTIRVPADLYAVLEQGAASSERSVNAEIVEQLRRAVSEDWIARTEHDREIARYLDVADLTRNATKMHERNWKAAAKDADLQVALLNSVCHHIISHGQAVPAHLRDFADKILMMNRQPDPWTPEEAEAYVNEFLNGNAEE